MAAAVAAAVVPVGNEPAARCRTEDEAIPAATAAVAAAAGTVRAIGRVAVAPVVQ